MSGVFPPQRKESPEENPIKNQKFTKKKIKFYLEFAIENLCVPPLPLLRRMKNGLIYIN